MNAVDPKDTFLAFRVDKGPYGYGSITATSAYSRTALELDKDQVWVDLNKQLGAGTFGDVFEAVFVDGPRKGTRAVAKRAKERRYSGQELPEHDPNNGGTFAAQAQQAWQQWCEVVYESAPGFLRVESDINTRCASLCPEVVAPFLGHVEQQGSQWLLWEHVGGVQTLEDILESCHEARSLKPLAHSLGVEFDEGDALNHRRLVNEAARQLLVCCCELQKAGIAHRDIKPQNIIVANHQILLIDFGAAAVMGAYPMIGYDWNEAPGDAKYCPPERFIDELQWTKYDIYCVGLVLLRMAMPPLLSDDGYNVFRQGFRASGWDIDGWFTRLILSDPALQTVQGKPRSELPDLGLPRGPRVKEYERLAQVSCLMHDGRLGGGEITLCALKEGLAALRNDHVDGLVWDLLHSMLQSEPSLRPTAEEALSWVGGGKK